MAGMAGLTGLGLDRLLVLLELTPETRIGFGYRAGALDSLRTKEERNVSP